MLHCPRMAPSGSHLPTSARPLLPARLLILLASLLCFCSPDPKKEVRTSDARPDVFLILLDAARADLFEDAGGAAVATPSINRLARNGIRFQNHFSHSYYTRASLSQLFTSRYEAFPILDFFQGGDYPWWMRDEVLPADAALLPRLLTDAGYRTVIVSAHPFTTKDTILVKSFSDAILVAPDGTQPFAPAARVLESARRLIAAHRNQRRREPLFVYIHLLDTHMPYQTTGTEDRFMSASLRALTPGERSARRPLPIPHRQEKLSEEGMALLRAEARSRYEYVDAEVGKFSDAIERTSARRSLFVVTSDHGEALGESGYVGHHYGTFGMKVLHHIPLMIWGKGTIRPSAPVSGFTAMVDLAPTILRIAEVPSPRRVKFDGVALLDRGVPSVSSGRGGVAETMRRGWKTSRLAYQSTGKNFILTEYDDVYERSDAPAQFRRLGGLMSLPPEFRSFVTEYRKREASRREIPLGAQLRVPVSEFVLHEELAHPDVITGSDTCWAIPPFWYEQDRIPLRLKASCPPLRFRLDLPDGEYGAHWDAGLSNPELCRSAGDSTPLLTIQTSGSRRSRTFTCSDLSKGKLDLGSVNVTGQVLNVWVNAEEVVDLWLKDIHLKRPEGSPSDRTLSAEERQRLKSLGYLQ